MDLSPNTCVALEPLYVNTARAHNRGDLVPVENVERNGWTDMVADHRTPEAIDALGFDPYADPDGVSADDAGGAGFDITLPIDRVLGYVADDPARAEQVLQLEQARPASQQRSTLIEQLQKTVGS